VNVTLVLAHEPASGTTSMSDGHEMFGPVWAMPGDGQTRSNTAAMPMYRAELERHPA
jgi:hypothetical protein